MSPGTFSWRGRMLFGPLPAAVFVVSGIVVWLTAAREPWSLRVWMAGLLVSGAPVVWRTLRAGVRGHFATDIVATLAIVTAVVMQQPLVGLIVVLMQTGGEALERYAEGRASRAVQQLEDDAPRIANRVRDGRAMEIRVSEVHVGDDLLVRPGEMVPCDGVVTEGTSHLDVSRLTGEPLPLSAHRGTVVLSGSLNVEGAIHVRATAESRHSQYARIVQLVRSAAGSKSRLQRLADRYATWFTPITLAVCGVAWAWSGDATRVLAVLVVATPCPLILATPVAIIGGINRAASRQIIMRTGGALERLSDVRVVVFDKTGTLTVGRPNVARIVASPMFGEKEVLRFAGALEQHSGHALARSVVEFADSVVGPLPFPRDVVEEAGRGISGFVCDRYVSVGSRAYIDERTGEPKGHDREPPDHRGRAMCAFVAIDGGLAGSIEFADRVRPDARQTVRSLGSLGVREILLLSGDHASNVNEVAQAVGIDTAVGELLPAEKLERVAELSEREGPVMMVGDGANDAPALARAAVGVALAGHGGGVTAEAADVLILNDELGRLVDAITISRRTMGVARQSILVGLSLSGLAMLFAGAGYVAPVAGALLQELIDVAVILNALRASGPGLHARRADRRVIHQRSSLSSFPAH